MMQQEEERIRADERKKVATEILEMLRDADWDSVSEYNPYRDAFEIGYLDRDVIGTFIGIQKKYGTSTIFI